MKKNIGKYFLFISLVTNLFITIPAVVVFGLCSDIRFDLFKHFQARLGKPEIVFIGDSITLGGGVWAFRIGEYNFNVWNYGHGGLRIGCLAAPFPEEATRVIGQPTNHSPSLEYCPLLRFGF